MERFILFHTPFLDCLLNLVAGDTYPVGFLAGFEDLGSEETEPRRLNWGILLLGIVELGCRRAFVFLVLDFTVESVFTLTLSQTLLVFLVG